MWPSLDFKTHAYFTNRGEYQMYTWTMFKVNTCSDKNQFSKQICLLKNCLAENTDGCFSKAYTSRSYKGIRKGIVL